MAIQQATPIDATLEELYQSVENLCSHGMAEKVYQALKALVESYVQDCVQQFLGESLDKLIFMKKMNDCWSGHCRQMIMIRSIFLFLDRTYVLQHPSVMSIWELGLDTFRRCILTNQLGKFRINDRVNKSLVIVNIARYEAQKFHILVIISFSTNSYGGWYIDVDRTRASR